MARNYIILNGINSNTITGLLISTLPPITKPKQRTQIEEIDGRDGDIVTKLGYSAYEKEFEIGLYGDFDINEVISYFNTEGNVVFSNESDKYYKYQILDQIDYEKLIRFKTATVKMHVQPFKYPTEEEQIQVDATVVTGSGSNITLEYTSSGSTITSEVDGDTKQDGTPTPDTPVAVQVATGNQSVSITGKNLLRNSLSILQANNIAGTWNGNTYTQNNVSFTYNSDGSITVTGTASSNTNFYISRATGSYQYTTLPAGNYYITSHEGTGSNSTWKMQFNDGGSSKNIFGTGNNKEAVSTITESKNVAFYIIVYSGQNPNGATFYPMIATTSGAEYDIYQNQTYPITLGSIELCKIGDYQDRIYQNEGTWYIEKQIGKVILNGSEAWNLTNTQPNDTTFKSMAINITGKKGGDTNVLMTHFLNGGISSSSLIKNATSEFFWVNGGTTNTQTGVITTSQTTTAFKTWLSTNNVTVYYILDTPTTTEITDADLIAQLNALAGATTYDNQTNITVSGSLPASLSVSTQGMPNTVINNIGNIYAKPLITIYGSGNIGVYLNHIQVLQIALGDAGSITIDVATMEAYDKNTKVLMNRLVTGDYMNFLINSGENNLAFSGTVLGFTMDNYTRWI